jgi:diguanylate cyclase (GGDEF)-like protein
MRTAIARLIATLVEQCQQDSLTGLLNYQGFLMQLHQTMARAQRYHTPVSLLMLDLDHFGQLNKTLGHVVVNRLLTRFGALLRHTRAGDIPARFGGDEFALILPQTGRTAAATLAERLRQRVTALPLPPGATVPQLTCSIGVAEYTIPEDAEAFMTRADTALRRAKARRNCVEVDTPAMGAVQVPAQTPTGAIDAFAFVEVDRHVYRWDGEQYGLMDTICPA